MAEEWITDSTNGCRVWNPRPTPNETISWSGDCKSGLVSGQGTLRWYLDGVNTVTNIGTFQEGTLSGKGKTIWASGNQYEGDYVNFERTGKGVFTWKNGYRYEGDFLKGAMKGFESCVGPTPVYPEDVKEDDLKGEVLVQAEIENGLVKSVQILSGESAFHLAVQTAVMQYKCPAVKGPAPFRQKFVFSLKQRPAYMGPF